jgi:NADH-ubiquinone oxidoreductase chain 6
MNSILLDLLAFGAVLSGILVITSRNPVISVLFLIAVFVNVACYLLLLGINFIGLAYLIVYVGAIAILFLFVVMMMNIKLVEVVSSRESNNNNLPLAAILGSLFVYELFSVVPTSVSGIKSSLYKVFDKLNFFSVNTTTSIVGGETNDVVIYSRFNELWDNTFHTFQQLDSLGISLYTTYTLFLIIASLILLLAMIGPIVLTHKPTKRIH